MKKNKKQIKQPKVFISYCWADNSFVNNIDDSFKSFGLTLTRDIRDAKDYTSIKDFMNNIRSSDFIILVISSSYMKSNNCMYEILELLKNKNYKDKIFPIIIRDDKFDIYSNDAISKWIQYWKMEYDRIFEESKTYNREDTVEINNTLRIITTIKLSIGSFIDTLQDLISPSLEELEATKYKSIRDKILLTGKTFDKHIFRKCGKFLSSEESEEATNKYEFYNHIELGDWLLVRIKPNYSHGDDERTERFVLATEIIKEIDQETKTTIAVKYDLISYYNMLKHNFIKYANDLYTVDSFYYLGEKNKDERIKVTDRINLIIHALVTIGYFKNNLFDAGIILESLTYINSEVDKGIAIEKFDTSDIVEFGDWLLERIEPNTFHTRYSLIVRRFIVLAKIIKSMGSLTERAKNIRDNLIEQSHISYGYDEEYNDFNRNREYTLQECLRILD